MFHIVKVKLESPKKKRVSHDITYRSQKVDHPPSFEVLGACMRERRVGSGEEVGNCAESPKSSQMIKCLRTAETWPGLERS